MSLDVVDVDYHKDFLWDGKKSNVKRQLKHNEKTKKISRKISKKSDENEC